MSRRASARHSRMPFTDAVHGCRSRMPFTDARRSAGPAFSGRVTTPAPGASDPAQRPYCGVAKSYTILLFASSGQRGREGCTTVTGHDRLPVRLGEKEVQLCGSVVTRLGFGGLS